MLVRLNACNSNFPCLYRYKNNVGFYQTIENVYFKMKVAKVCDRISSLEPCLTHLNPHRKLKAGEPESKIKFVKKALTIINTNTIESRYKNTERTD